MKRFASQSKQELFVSDVYTSMFVCDFANMIIAITFVKHELKGVLKGIG